MDYNFEELAPICFMYERGTQRSKDISKRLRKEFLSGASITNHSLTGLNNVKINIWVNFHLRQDVHLVFFSVVVRRWCYWVCNAPLCAISKCLHKSISIPI